MTVNDYYAEAIKENHYSLQLLIEYLIYEKNVIRFSDGEEKLLHYLQPRFARKMNEYLADYEVKRNGQLNRIS